ncbi:MAG: deiodinase-like protein [Paracoccaceae bacterium]
MPGYNYDSFTSQDYDFDTETGPGLGQKAPDFALTTSTGARRNLLDFDGDFLVLEMGSITCPLFQGRRRIMSRLEMDNPRVSHAILYVREAHPGADIPSHANFAEKTACAERLRVEDGETRLVLVDDFEGHAHAAYGAMPNAVFIINANGCVVFTSDWNNPSATRSALKALLAGKKARSKSYFRPVPPWVLARILGRAGKGSARDFFKSLPALIRANIFKRNLRLLLNKPAIAPPDSAC